MLSLYQISCDQIHLVCKCTVNLCTQNAYEYTRALLETAKDLHRKLQLNPDDLAELQTLLGALWSQLERAIEDENRRIEISRKFNETADFVSHHTFVSSILISNYSDFLV